MTYANDIKVALISAMLPALGPDEVIGLEVRFGDGRYRADLVLSSPTKLIGIEIKGPRDNLDKLVKQAIGYRQLFLEFFVAAAPAHIDQVRDMFPPSVGLMAFSEKTARQVRAARVRRRLSKSAALSWLHVEDMRVFLRARHLPTSGTYERLAEAISAVCSVDELSAYALECVHRRLSPRFARFVNELGRTVTLDDVHILTLGETVIGSGGQPALKRGN
jgi:hypothetical protein